MGLEAKESKELPLSPIRVVIVTWQQNGAYIMYIEYRE